MPEKCMVTSKFILYLILFSVFLLVCSSWVLPKFTNQTLILRSVYKLVPFNNTWFSLKPNFQSETPFTSRDSNVNAETPLKNREQGGRISNASQKRVSGSRKRKKECDLLKGLLRVYMYDLSPEFHFGMLGWKGMVNQTWPEVDKTNQIPQYPGAMYTQNSMEYWLTLDLLSSKTPNVERHCNAIRVKNSSEADVVFVPFFSSLSYNQNCKIHGKTKDNINWILQEKLVEFLLSREEWKRSGGKDHLVMAHHPNSILYARKNLSSAMFLLADFGRYPLETANLNKDIVAPYTHFVPSIPRASSASFQERPTLLFFRGGIHRKNGGMIRQELYDILKDEKDVYFKYGDIKGDGINEASKGMAFSKFCLNIAGDTPSSNRLFDSIVSHCVPVVISDEIELPFEDVLDYSEFCLFVRAADAVKTGYLLSMLRVIKQDTWTKMWERLKEVAQHFEYQYPSQPGDAVDMIWKAVSHKLCLNISLVQLTSHRKNRYRSSDMLSNNN